MPSQTSFGEIWYSHAQIREEVNGPNRGDSRDPLDRVDVARESQGIWPQQWPAGSACCRRSSLDIPGPPWGDFPGRAGLALEESEPSAVEGCRNAWT
jgi:hypothetical protein